MILWLQALEHNTVSQPQMHANIMKKSFWDRSSVHSTNFPRSKKELGCCGFDVQCFNDTTIQVPQAPDGVSMDTPESCNTLSTYIDAILARHIQSNSQLSSQLSSQLN